MAPSGVSMPMRVLLFLLDSSQVCQPTFPFTMIVVAYRGPFMVAVLRFVFVVFFHSFLFTIWVFSGWVSWFQSALAGCVVSVSVASRVVSVSVVSVSGVVVWCFMVCYGVLCLVFCWGFGWF